MEEGEYPKPEEVPKKGWERQMTRRALLKGGIERATGLLAAAAISRLPQGAGEAEAKTVLPPLEISKQSFEALPPDPGIPELAPIGKEWTQKAVILQPWGETQYLLMKNPEIAQRLKEYGFNTVIVLPPEAHNAITDPKHHLTSQEWNKAIETYRQAGYRLILYSSIMHAGLTPAWRTEEIAQQHPEWSQRDSQGGVVTQSGKEAPWLCPSTGALEYTLNYTKDLVEKYHPNAIMLDNNGFFKTEKGATCYCTDCQRKFADYVNKRFGTRKTTFFGNNPIRIPGESGPLYNLWIHWRNRVWAEATEEFRNMLAEVAPQTVLFGNTQYKFDNWHLATDLQFTHEDLVFSESSEESWDLSAKMLLGKALSGGNRPLWNYLTTFRTDNENNFDYLRPPGQVKSIISTTMAHLANPWLVYYGFDKHDAQNQESREEITKLFSFRKNYPDLFHNLKPLSPIGTLFSTLSRNYQKTPFIPNHLRSLQEAGIPIQGVSDTSHPNFDHLKFLVAEHAASLPDDLARNLTDWLAAGGTLIATTDLGKYDAIGRLKPQSLAQKLQSLQAQNSPALGAGKLILADNAAGIPQIVKQEAADWQFTKPESVEIVPYVSEKNDETVLHIVNHGEPLIADWELHLPQALVGHSAQLFSPDRQEPISLKLASNILTIPPDAYGVVVISK